MNPDLTTLAARAAAGDPFALLGLPHGFDVDLVLLKRRYLELSRRTHPDFFATHPEELPAAQAVSAALNLALATLEDPVRRAEYLLLRHGGQDRAQDQRVAPELLEQVMTLQERIEEARTAGDDAGLLSLRTQLLAERAIWLERISLLARELPTEEGNMGPAAILRDLRLALNAMRYVQNALARVCPLGTPGGTAGP